jgi:DNA-binding response OmpR family regulator
MVLLQPVLAVRHTYSHVLSHPRETVHVARMPRVLIVEDDADVREALTATIEDAGFHVSQAQDGITGLASAERDAPDLVLLDLMLPKRSGITVLEQLKARRIHRIPVIMMSGSRDSRHRDLVAGHHADAFLLKPFDGELFLRTAMDLLPQFPRHLFAMQTV